MKKVIANPRCHRVLVKRCRRCLAYGAVGAAFKTRESQICSHCSTVAHRAQRRWRDMNILELAQAVAERLEEGVDVPALAYSNLGRRARVLSRQLEKGAKHAA